MSEPEKLLTDRDRRNMEVLRNITSGQTRYYDYEAKSFLFGFDTDVDVVILGYLRHPSNEHGCPLERLTMHFCFETSICTKKRLQRRLESLEKYGLIRKDKYATYIIYVPLKDVKEIKNKSEVVK